MSNDLRQEVRRLVEAEKGTIFKDAPERVALVYPSPYRAGMSSLGFQAMYREINAAPGRCAETAARPNASAPASGCAAPA